MTSNWPQVPLGDLLDPVVRPVDVRPDETYREIGIRSHGRGIFHKEPVSGLELGNKRVFWIEPGNFVLNIVFAWEGAVAITGPSEQGMIGSHRFPAFRARADRLDPRFLLWFFKTPQGLDLLGRVSPGGAGRNRTLSKSAFLQQSVPVPSLDEQRRIVERLERLESQVAEAADLCRRAEAEAAQLVGAVVGSAFSALRRGDCFCGGLGDVIAGACYGTSEKTHDEPSGLPILRMGNIQEGVLDIRDVKYLPFTSGHRDNLVLQKGDILVNRTNSPELVGKSAVFDLDGVWGFASYLIRIRLDASRADSRLVTFYINSPAGRTYMLGSKKQMTGQANVSIETLRALPVVLPPMQKQLEMADLFERIRVSSRDATANHALVEARLRALQASALGRALAGEF